MASFAESYTDEDNECCAQVNWTWYLIVSIPDLYNLTYMEYVL